MDVRMREVPAQVVVTEQRMVDQQSLEGWLPEAMARLHDCGEHGGRDGGAAVFAATMSATSRFSS